MLNLKYPGMAEGYDQTKVHQQVNRPSGPKAHPKHLAALRAAKKMPRVRVEPANEELRHVLRHPNAPAFRNSGSVEWPLDRFTHRRLREGSIKIVEHIVEGRREPVPENNRPQERHARRSSNPSVRDQSST